MTNPLILAGLLALASVVARAEELTPDNLDSWDKCYNSPICIVPRNSPTNDANATKSASHWDDDARTPTATTVYPTSPTWHLLTQTLSGVVDIKGGLTKDNCETRATQMLDRIVCHGQGVCIGTIQLNDIIKAECFQ